MIGSLVRRDYAVQYAGTALGFLWVVGQYAFQIGVYFAIFGWLLPAAGGRGVTGPGSGDYLAYLLGGMGLWLPLSDGLLRCGSILADNRALIRRTDLGMFGFLWLPIAQALIHYVILFALIGAVLALRGNIAWTALAAPVWAALVLLALSGWGFILARASVLLRDLTPLLRLLFQLIFWLSPIVYAVNASLVGWFAWNPLYGPLELHRALMVGAGLERALDPAAWKGAAALALLSLPAYVLSARRLKQVVEDHI